MYLYLEDMKWVFFIRRMRRIVLLSALLLCYQTEIFCQEDIYPYIDQGKIGFKDLSDSVLIDPIYDYYEPFRPRIPVTVIGTGEYERLNNNASERQVKFKGKFGLVNAQGREIVAPFCDIVFQVYEHYTIAGIGSGHLVFNNWPEGKEIFFDGKIGLIRHDGIVVIPFAYNEISIVHSDTIPYWLAVDDQHQSYLYRDSVLLDIPVTIEEISDFSEGRARIRTDGKYGFIDQAGKVVVPTLYDRAKDYSGGQAFVKLSDRYAWIDTAGREIADNQSIVFEEVGEYSEGYARVKVFDDYGFIRPDSSFFIFPRFAEASPFFNQIASVRGPDSFGYVYTNGTEDIVQHYEKSRINIPLPPNAKAKLPAYEAEVIQSADTAYFFKPLDSLTLESLVDIHINALRWAPSLYFNYPQMLGKVSAGEGTLSGRYLFNRPYLTPGNSSWEGLKKGILLKILSDDSRRSVFWKMVKPYYRISFQSMPALHQKVYREMIDYLEDYYDRYDVEKTREFLENKESFFAHEHPDGSTSPYRKVSAQIDRLILIYKAITVEDVRKWIRKINKEVAKW